ncbi:hypothetical protein [Rhodopila sp.]|uniref:hypothetical protein n=1 Tax=Rhodopila sp. TaxID=2480087 RepID=UPI003D1220DB
MSNFSDYVMNGFGAPHLSELTECGALEIDEPKNYLGSLVLNNLFTVRYPDPMKRLTVMFGRRSDDAVRQHRAGWELLLSYIQRLPQGNDHFLVALRAVTHFEHCIGSTCQADALFRRLIDLVDGRDPSEPPDSRDRERRLRLIWNRAKHFDEDLKSPNIVAEDITAPVWLTNTGISAERATVTWIELHSVLTAQQEALKYVAETLPNKIVEMRKVAEQPDVDT